MKKKESGWLLMILLSLFSPASAQPSPRSGHVLAFDSRHRCVMLYGGVDGQQQRLSDLWNWEGARWTEVKGAGPGPRLDAQMAYDSRRGRLVLFGGIGAEKRQGDTWEWDWKQWRRVAADGPEARSLGALAYDEGRGRVVLFGGQNAARQRLGDTWEWDGQSWMRVSQSGPSPRGSHAMTYHAGRKRVMLLGGYDGRALGDLWEWDGQQWQLVAAAGLPPRMHFAFGYDRRRARLLVFGGFGESERIGDTWEWDGKVWTQANAAGPAARAEHEGVFFPGRGFVIFGGIVGLGMDVTARDRVNDLWRWNGTKWRQETPAKPKMVVGQGTKLVAPGIGAGLMGAFSLTRLIASLLFNISATDSTTFIVISVILAGVALGACFVPALRAAKVDPVVALRYE